MPHKTKAHPVRQPPAETLTREMTVYGMNLPRWLKEHQDSHVLIKDHEVAGLYVVDSSVFPTNLGVNPQHSIMAMSRLAATRIVAGGRARHAA